MVVVLAPLALVAAAIMAVLLVYGAILLSHLLAQWFADAPVIGGWLAGRIESGISRAVAGVRSMIDAAARPVVDLFEGPAQLANGFVAAAVAAADHVMASVVWVTTVFFPAVARQIDNSINEATVQIERWIAHSVVPTIDSVIGTVQSQLAQAFRDLAGLSDRVTANTDAIGTKADRADLGAIDNHIDQVSSKLAQANAAIDGQHAQITAIGGQVAAIPGYVDSQVRAGVGAAEGYANGAVGSLNATLAPAIAAAAAVAADAAQFVKECGEPMCDWWHGNSSGLAGLLQAISLAELAVLVVEAAEHPKAAAEAASGAYSAVSGLSGDVLGAFGINVPAGR